MRAPSAHRSCIARLLRGLLRDSTHLGLGWLYLYQQRYEEAEVPLRAFLENIREKGEVYYALGKAYQGGGKFEKARDAYQRAVELTEDNPMFTSVLEELLKNHPELSNS